MKCCRPPVTTWRCANVHHRSDQPGQIRADHRLSAQPSSVRAATLSSTAKRWILFTLQPMFIPCRVNGINPLRIPVNTKLPTNKTGFATSYTETLKVNNQKSYSNYAPGEDAWFDTAMLVYTTPKTWTFPFTIDGLATATTPNPTNLMVKVWGITNWEANPDHHLKVILNGVTMADQTFDGLVEQTFNIPLPAGVLIEGSNSLQLTLPGDSGLMYELQNFDQFSVTYPRMFKAKDGQLSFTAAGKAFKVTNLPSNSVVVYRRNPSGVITRLASDYNAATDGTYTAAFLGDSLNSTYFVSATASCWHPDMRPPVSRLT